MNIPYAMKKCSKCGRWLVASKVNFNKCKKGKYGLQGYCRECNKKQHKQYCKVNKEKIAEQRKQYREANKEKIAEKNKRYREANKERIAEYAKKYHEANRDKENERSRRYYEANRDKECERRKRYHEANREKENERRKRYHEANRDKDLEKCKKWYENNKEKVLERVKEYSQTPQGQVVAFNKSQRRRAKQQQQGSGITKDQWLEMMSFFDWECAYSGEVLSKDTRSIDHIVPLNSNGDNMIWNCVPMKLNYNSSKHAKDMLEWYREQDFYSEDRLAKIYKWQEYARKKWEN